MYVREFIRNLTYGELYNLGIVDKENMVIKPEHMQDVVDAINLGYRDLGTRFPLKIVKIELNQIGTLGIDLINDIPYDLPNFVELLKVVVDGKEVTDYELRSITSIRWLKPYDSRDYKAEIYYRAYPSYLRIQDTNNDSVPMEVPPAYINALLYFVAARMYTSIVNQLDGDLQEYDRYMQKYINEIHMLKEQGIDVDTAPQLCQFVERGFI